MKTLLVMVLFVVCFQYKSNVEAKAIQCKSRKNVITCHNATMEKNDVLVIRGKSIRIGREYFIVLEKINGEFTLNSLRNFPRIYNVLIVRSNISKIYFSHSSSRNIKSVFPIVIQESTVSNININTKIVRSVSIYDSTVPDLTDKFLKNFCGNLTGMLVINATASRVEEGAFKSCKKLSELTLRRTNLKSLTKRLFDGLQALEILIIEDPIDAIEERTFNDMVSLKKLQIDTEIDMLPPDTLRKLTNLRVLSLRGKKMQISGLHVFSELKNLEVLEIPTDLLISLPAKKLHEVFPSLRIVVLDESYMKSAEAKTFVENVNYTILYTCPYGGQPN